MMKLYQMLCERKGTYKGNYILHMCSQGKKNLNKFVFNYELSEDNVWAPSIIPTAGTPGLFSGFLEKWWSFHVIIRQTMHKKAKDGAFVQQNSALEAPKRLIKPWVR